MRNTVKKEYNKSMTQKNEQRLSSKNIIITRLLLYKMAVYTCVLQNQVGKPQTAHAEPLSRVHAQFLIELYYKSK